jgi:ATP-binding cassette subfamily F protein uup
MTATLITLANLQLAYGHHALLDRAELTIHQGERIGLIGRNGAGKSSLLKLLDGRAQPDDGEIQRLGGLRIATVEQEPELGEHRTVLDEICGEFERDEDWARPARAKALISELGLQESAFIDGLSGGTRKRIALARAMTLEPDLLLLDEPTNHLDFEGITWLEQRLKRAAFSIVLITHDRRFLDTVTTRIVELDRGKLISFPGNFTQWQERKAEWLEAEMQQNAKFDKLLAQEEVWIRKGIEARRTRNEGRVRRLEQLRRERAARRERTGNVNLAISEGQRSGKIVAELEHVTHGYHGRTLINNLSTVILRKDRIGIIGPNGAGKTTLLRILLGELKPDQGSVKSGTNLNIAYFDQMRGQLDETATVADTISPGSEWVEIGDQRKHIMSYLEDFLFPPARARSPVSSLSGGERARLVLARLFATPSNVLVLDEPTNDLDIETLELLEELLQDYPGTVLLVSHDRVFLNNVVTQTIVSEPEGHWQEYAGGYDDWLVQSNVSSSKNSSQSAVKSQTQAADDASPHAREDKTPGKKPAANRASRFTAWEEKELEGIPEKIAKLEARQAELGNTLSDPKTYENTPDIAIGINNEITEIDDQLNRLFERWEELESKKTGTQ